MTAESAGPHPVILCPVLHAPSMVPMPPSESHAVSRLSGLCMIDGWVRLIAGGSILMSRLHSHLSVHREMGAALAGWGEGARAVCSVTRHSQSRHGPCTARRHFLRFRMAFPLSLWSDQPSPSAVLQHRRPAMCSLGVALYPAQVALSHTPAQSERLEYSAQVRH